MKSTLALGLLAGANAKLVPNYRPLSRYPGEASARGRGLASVPIARNPNAEGQGEDLRQFEVIEDPTGADIKIDLKVNQWRFKGPPGSARVWTRVYNPDADVNAEHTYLKCGPTIKFLPGQKITVNLQNQLGPNKPVNADTRAALAECLDHTDIRLCPKYVDPNAGGHVDHNYYHNPNTTNLHVHGLHISAQTGKDDVFSVVDPGSSLEYEYDMLPNHHGGTFWYHAHAHGSTGLQAGGGMFGALIVHDTPGDLPDEFAAMPEWILMMAHVGVGEQEEFQLDLGDFSLAWMAIQSGDTLTTNNYQHDGKDFFLTNGQFEPVINLKQGQWTRLRMIFAATHAAINISILQKRTGCTFQLLAKDGVYVDPAPRNIESAHMTSGNRCDLVVMCTGVGDAQLISGDGKNGVSHAGTTYQFDSFGFDIGIAYWNGLMATIRVAASDSAIEGALPVFSPRRPDYLVDLLSYENPVRDFNIDFSHRHGGGCGVNNVTYIDADHPIHEMQIGTVQEFSFAPYALWYHPFHLHVNNFQILNMVDPTGFYRDGDWQDVLLMPWHVVFTPADGLEFGPRIRVNVDRFTGYSVFHCHFINHEDLGCMAHITISGEEGTRVGMTEQPMKLHGSTLAVPGSVNSVASMDESAAFAAAGLVAAAAACTN